MKHYHSSFLSRNYFWREVRNHISYQFQTEMFILNKWKCWLKFIFVENNNNTQISGFKLKCKLGFCLEQKQQTIPTNKKKTYHTKSSLQKSWNDWEWASGTYHPSRRRADKTVMQIWVVLCCSVPAGVKQNLVFCVLNYQKYLVSVCLT